VAFADHGSREQLLATLQAIRADAETQREAARSQVGGYAETGGPFPQRLPVIALTGKFFLEYPELVARWAQRAEHALTTWDGVEPDAATVPACAFDAGRWPTPPPATAGAARR
jgi:hypothetical protein